ncbi:Uncharacterized protein OBRU01_05710 [Operophtera brumata]|uniref:Uncharacterized protein n=1 Tax=Operophtera brumata TaxID=104452 RepID=A0A0L7LLY2_OPEBR|nr:Uncharacterized protein OBRU01_05710 [Operophtera brumata]
MSKGVNKAVATDSVQPSKSTFTLTFALEILGIDVWQDCDPGRRDLGPYEKGLKIQYQLYPGQSNTWLLLRLPLGQAHLVLVVFPPLVFPGRRYFAPVLETEESLLKFIRDLIWSTVVQYIPASCMDGVFDVPHPVAGTGRIVPFETVGDRPPDLGEIIVLISTNNLPAADDYPVVFVNVGNLCDVPLNEFKALRITQLYTRWKIGEEVHDSEPQPIRSTTEIAFNDHHAIPLPHELVSNVMAGFSDASYEVQLRGIRALPQKTTPLLFGYQKGDRDFDFSVPKLSNNDLDFLIAVTKIHTNKLAKSINSFIRGEYPLYPPSTSVRALGREGVCTNDINAIRTPGEPELVVKPDMVLLAQMTLEISIGLVGCTVRHQSQCFSRMFCLMRDSGAIMSILRSITTINKHILEIDKRGDMLTGFMLDTGDVGLLFVEGPKDGHILHVWDMTEDFYPNVKPLYACSRNALYCIEDVCAIRSAFGMSTCLCTSGFTFAYKSCKTASKLNFPPSRSNMPTGGELRSLRLELCVAPRPIPELFTGNTMKKAGRCHTRHFGNNT